MPTGRATMENSMDDPQEIKNGSTIWYIKNGRSSNPTSRYVPKETKPLFRIDICTPMFTAALFTTARVWQQVARRDLATSQKVDYNANRGKHGSRETSEEATAIIQASGKGGLDWESSNGWMRSGWIPDMF